MKKKSLILAISFVLFVLLNNKIVKAQSAFSFNSTNTTTCIKIGNKPALGLSQFTLECWFKRTGTGVTASTGTGGVTAAIPLITKGTSEADGSTVDCNYFFGINTTGNVLCADFEEGSGGTTPGLNHPISGVTPIVNNVWYHGAATYDGSTWKLYLNGILEASLIVNQPAQNLSIQPSALGSSIRSNGTTLQGFFAGVMDEARIWNSARSISQIQSTINSQISVPQAGMVARWGFNEGSGTTVGDISGNALAGTVSGTAFTWTTSVAPFNLTFGPVNYSPTISANSPASGNKCLGTTSVNLNVSVNDQNTFDVLTVKFYGRTKKAAPTDFTIVGLPDTQFYTEQGSTGGTNTIFKAQTSWIVANKNALNIAHISQLGDCTQNGDNGGNDTEWKRADTSMKVIENPATTGLADGIPYTMNVGNHDQSPNGSATGTTTFFNQYFGTSRFSGRSYWGGNYGSNADNSYQLFSINGMDFIVISLEYDPNADPAVLAWANNLLQTNSSRKGIIVSHYIVNADATFGTQGQAIYNALKGNANLMLMLCGHVNPNGESYRSDVFNARTVYSLLSDYQDLTNGGNGWMRIMTLSPSTNTLSVKTFSPTLNQYQTDANSQYTLTNMNLFNDATPYQLLSTQSATGSGTLTYNWNILTADSMYEWYATVADTQYTVSSTVNNFGTYSKPVVALGSDISVLCNNLQTLDAGNPGKTYLWSTGATTQTITPNSNGVYSVLVSNPISGCFNSDTIQVTITGKPVATITPNIAGTCTGGIATLTATTGMSAYSWSTGETASAITVNSSGTYSVTVTNSVGCTSFASQAITIIPLLTTTVTATNISCFGGSNGTAAVTVTGSSTPFTYSWSTGATTQNISGMTAGTYTVMVSDNGGCASTKTVSITQPAPLLLGSPTIVTTNGGYNGTITANPAGGTTPYNYLWRYNNAGANITTQSLGTTHVGGIYSVTITDNKGCTVGGNYSHIIPVVATSTVLVPWSSTWKYKDDGSNQGTAWRGTSFDDSGWSSGQTELGYGDGDETTLINACGTVVQLPSCTNKYITTYLRKNITVTDPTIFQNIKFNAFRDDGIIVYVNNNEVYRSNMPTTAVTYTTVSSTNVSDDGETLQTQTVVLASSFFVAGNNTIAVEVHQTSGSSSDLTFNMEILGVPSVPEVLTRGPYLQKLTTSGITIKWSTDVAVKSQINYGTDSLNLNNSITDNNNVTSHTLTLTGLIPYTKYYYSIGSPTLKLQGNGQNFFITAPAVGTEGKYNFWLVGDCGNNSTNQAQVRDRYNAYMGNTPTNGWLLLGDNAYTNGADAEYQTEFFNVYQGSIMKNAPLYPAPGNHDYNNGAVFDHSVPYYTLFDMPSNGEAGGVPSGTKAYYSYDYGNAHFLSLDSYGKEDNINRLYDTLGQQVQWIKQDLAANTNKKFVIAYWHHPPYTMGSHNSDTEAELANIRKNFIRILERNGVDLIVCGHSHDYERSKLMNGNYGLETTFNPAQYDISTSNGRYDGTSNSCTYVKDSIHGYAGTIYVVAGSAGQLDNGAVQSSFPHDAMNGFNNSTNGGSGLLTIEGNRLDMKWICADGVIRDQFTLIKDANKRKQQTINYGQSVTLAASWKGQYIWNHNGATTQSVVVAPTATTRYAVADQYQCVTDSFTINVIVPTITPSLNVSTICAGSSLNVPFTASAGFNIGNTFTAQLSDGAGSFANPTDIGTLNAIASDTISVTIPGSGILAGNNYKIRITSSNPAIAGSPTSNFIISSPVINVSSSDADNVICQGSSLTLTATQGFNSYLWSNGYTTQSIEVASSGSLTVMGTNSHGCNAISPARVVTVNSLPEATITPAGSTTFCAGDSVKLEATDNMNSYLWSNGEITGFITAKTSGDYSVTIIDVNGCMSSSSAITIATHTLPEDCNGDGIVSQTDLNSLYIKFGTSCICTEDVTGDGMVSQADLNLLYIKFGQACH